MPHKRAKRSEREKKRATSGDDLAPGVKRAIESEEIPKSLSRVLNAAKVRRDWAEKKRKAADEDGVPKKKRRRDSVEEERGARGDAQLRIMPGESMAHFNRRVEDALRPSVREAMQASSARVRQARKEEAASKTGNNPTDTKALKRSREKSASPQSDSEHDQEPARKKEQDIDKPKDFEKLSTSAPKRLNDIVQAPPELKKLPRKAKKLVAQGDSKKGDSARSLREGVLSMAQKAMMEEERERVIRLYREMKKERTAS